MRDLFTSLDHVDHVALLAGSRLDGEIATLDTAMIQTPVNDRLWGALYVCKHAAPKMTDGSITICSGVGVARPRRGAAVVAAAAGAGRSSPGSPLRRSRRFVSTRSGPALSTRRCSLAWPATVVTS